ncbi:unnamed protein product [Durusdinium trenchii]|uniref:Methyltransferase FkbM domain-containing protein n=1 Tax=Durusdinium trenchii TaxID=1381693 RepID=A0ABP0JEP0_9DINO
MAPLWRGAVASLPLALVAEVPDEGAMKIREGLAAVEWCAMMMNFQPQELLEQCCYQVSSSSACAMELADSVGAKCCRSDTEMSGFYGFLLPPRPFSLNGRPNDMDPCSTRAPDVQCLFSWNNFHILGPQPLEELRALGLLGTEEGHMVSLHATTSPPLMDVVQVNSLAEEVPIFYHRLFHEYAEVAPQALWEYTHYVQHRQSFRPLARRGRGCEQPEAAEAKAMADTTALPWLALRWLERGNPPFNSFVNLGARDGVGDDPLQFLLQDPRHVDFALAVEMDPEYCQRHRQHLPHVQVLCLQVSEATMPEILQKVPRAARSTTPRLDVLKVDLDGADCDAALGFLSSVRAKLVVLEVFDGLPPPLRFSLHEHPQLASWGGLTVWGCSLSYQVRMLKPLGYHLVWYGAGNAIYVHRSVSTRLGLPRLDEVDCYVTSVVMAMWPSGRRMRRWFYEVRSCDRWWRHIGVTHVKRPGII